MQITVFIEELQEQSRMAYGAAWYITFSNHKILFIMNSFEKFYSQVREWAIPVEEMVIRLRTADVLRRIAGHMNRQ